jgi:hypothetical protein
MHNHALDNDFRWELAWRAVVRQVDGDRYNRALNAIEKAPAPTLLRFWRSKKVRTGA